MLRIRPGNTGSLFIHSSLSTQYRKTNTDNTNSSDNLEYPGNTGNTDSLEYPDNTGNTDSLYRLDNTGSLEHPDSTGNLLRPGNTDSPNHSRSLKKPDGLTCLIPVYIPTGPIARTGPNIRTAPDGLSHLI